MAVCVRFPNFYCRLKRLEKLRVKRQLAAKKKKKTAIGLVAGVLQRLNWLGRSRVQAQACAFLFGPFFRVFGFDSNTNELGFGELIG